MTAAIEQAILKVLDAKGWTGLIDLWVRPTLRSFDVEDIGQALGSLIGRGVIEADPERIRYRIKAEQISPDDINRALGDHY